MKRNSVAFARHTLLILFLALPGCTHKRHIDKKELYFQPSTSSTHMKYTADTQYQLNTPPSPPPITIWVHGTLLFRKPHYHCVFHNKNSLVAAPDLPIDNLFYSLARSMAESDPSNFPFETFYFFGWSGKLHAIERKIAAEDLYQEILILIEQYKKKYNTEPVIRIIAHSHGGNVVLNMAKRTIESPITIHALILLACPVQEKTMNLINRPMFKNIYSLYSSLDFVQVLAPQIMRKRTVDTITNKRKHHYKFPPFSSRLFPQHNHLTQVKLKVNTYPIAHTSFVTPQFVQILPTILAELDLWHEETIKNNTFNKHKLLCVYQKKTH